MAERFLIGSYKTGLEKDKKPFLLPEEAFAVLRNAYVWRDRVRKRFGSVVMNQAVSQNVQQLYTRLRLKLGTTNGAGNLAGSTPLNAGVPIATPAVGQLFSIGDEIFTVQSLGTPTTLVSTTGTATVKTFNTTTGAYVFNGAAANTDVYYYPALPVMGLIRRELQNVNNEQTIAFDTRFAYTFNGTGWERLDTAYFWTGDDTQLFWGENYRGLLPNDRNLFVTNYRSADAMAYLDTAGTTFTRFQPYYINDLGAGIQLRVLTARVIVAFQGRLVLLNTVEELQGGGTGTFTNRARWCQFGNPVDQGNPAVTATGGWLEPPRVYGRGDHVDAPTSEAIQTALILKDRLIVYFERSTWELVYTGNQVLPFVWQTINIELGAESTFSIVPFDKVLLGVGDVGIHACNGANVTRIDDKIPDDVFEIQNVTNGPQRVYGVRDYSSEMVYWAYPYLSTPNTTFNNRVFVYNYRNGAWAFNDDSITCFGQYQLDATAAWNTTDVSWEDADFTWNAGALQALSRNVIAGNQQGFVFVLSTPNSQRSTNASVISITDVSESGLVATFTVINHNLTSGDYIYIANMTSDNDPDGTITDLNNKIWQVLAEDANTFIVPIDTAFAPGANYTGGGTFRRVSIIDIVTKQYNFFLDQGYSFSVNKIDMLVDKVPNGEVSVKVYPNSSTLPTDTDVLTLYPYDERYAPTEQWQDMLWHTIYPNSFGSFLQFQITLEDNDNRAISQTRNPDKADADFVLNAMFVYATPTSMRLQ